MEFRGGINFFEEMIRAMQLGADLFPDQTFRQHGQVQFHDLGPVHQAVIRNDRNRLQTLLRRGESCNACDDKIRMTPLILAAANGYTAIVKILLDAGANVNLLDESGQSNHALHVAVASGSLEVVKLVLSAKGCNVDATPTTGYTALHMSTELDNGAVAKALLAAGANINAKSPHLLTPLCLSIGKKKMKVFNVLISAGANVNTTDRQFVTPLHLAIRFGFPLDKIRQLIDRSADVNARDAARNIPLHMMSLSDNFSDKVARLLLEKGSNVNAKNADGNTALHLTAVMNLPDKDTLVKIAQVLVEHGVNVNDLNYANRYSALHLAISKSHKEVALYLMANGADVNIGAPDSVKPLHMAIMFTKGPVQIEMVEALLKHGADSNARDELGHTPLHFALQNNSIPGVVRLLLTSGCCFDAKLDVGTKRLPADLAPAHGSAIIRELLALAEKFFQAICKNNVDKVKKYLESDKFLVHCRSAHYKTPLHFPTWKGFAEMVTLLLEHGADPNVANTIYSSPLHYAAKYDHSRIVEELIRNGAHVNAICSVSKKTPLKIAQDSKSLACLMVLVSMEQIFDAVSAGDREVVKQIDYFKNMGAGPFKVLQGARNADGKSLVEIASGNNHEEIVAALTSFE